MKVKKNRNQKIYNPTTIYHQTSLKFTFFHTIYPIMNYGVTKILRRLYLLHNIFKKKQQRVMNEDVL